RPRGLDRPPASARFRAARAPAPRSSGRPSGIWSVARGSRSSSELLVSRRAAHTRPSGPLLRRADDGLAAGAVAGAVSALPSTLWALARGEDPLAATVAAGSILLPAEERRGWLVAAAVPVHATLCLA